MSKKEKQLSTTPWINEEILAKIDYAPRQTQDPKVLISTQNFFPRQIKKSKTGYRAAKNGAGQFDQPPGNSVITVTYPGVDRGHVSPKLFFCRIRMEATAVMVFPIQAKVDSALSSAVFAVLTASARAKGALGVPVTFGARDQIVKSKYKE